MRRELVRSSKLLSLVLRHDPARFGLELDSEGWIHIDPLLQALAESNRPLTRDELVEIVDTNEKRRFAISEDGKRIRARQGHSVAVNLGLSAQTPPTTLFHGTAERLLDSILQQGLLKQSRQHVHLSADIETARAVGRRHGKPVVLIVEAEALAESGAEFFISENGPDYPRIEGIHG